jgi:hypothetical protein
MGAKLTSKMLIGFRCWRDLAESGPSALSIDNAKADVQIGRPKV